MVNLCGWRLKETLYGEKIGKLSQFDACRAGVAAFSLWEIWVGRCAAVFEGSPMKARRICLKVISQVQLISLVHSPAKISGKLQVHRMGIIGRQSKAMTLH